MKDLHCAQILKKHEHQKLSLVSEGQVLLLGLIWLLSALSVLWMGPGGCRAMGVQAWVTKDH